MKEEKKKLRIFSFTDYSPYGDAAVAHAFALCMIFRAELCIMPLQKEQKSYSDTFKHVLELADQRNIIVTHYPDCPGLRKKIYQFVDEYNGMMMVIAVSKDKKDTFFTCRKALPFIKKSRVPVLAVGKTLPLPNAYQHVILPLDSSIYSKEKSLWASYFSRFYNAYVHVLYKNYKDQFLRYKLQENVGFTEKLYTNLEVLFLKHKVEDMNEDIDSYARTFAKSVNASLVLSMTTKYPSLFELILGTKEKKTITYVDEIPYLYINQRYDLYVLCT